MKIARRFNPGTHATPTQVPKGRLKDGADAYPFNRPFGTRFLLTTIPALKRRAIIGMSLRDKLSSNFPTALSANPDASQILSTPRGDHLLIG